MLVFKCQNSSCRPKWGFLRSNLVADDLRWCCVVLAQVEMDSVTETIERRVIEWKFDQLDKNGDGNLNRREFRVLRRLVRKVVRPKRCTKNFPRHCDSDQNRKISHSEWSVCLGVGINSKSLPFHFIRSSSLRHFLSNIPQNSRVRQTILVVQGQILVLKVKILVL